MYNEKLFVIGGHRSAPSSRVQILDLRQTYVLLLSHFSILILLFSFSFPSSCFFPPLPPHLHSFRFLGSMAGWQEGPSLLCERTRLSVAVCDDSIYAIGLLFHFQSPFFLSLLLLCLLPLPWSPYSFLSLLPLISLQEATMAAGLSSLWRSWTCELGGQEEEDGGRRRT